MKQKIRLTESDLHRMIKESVKEALKEAYKGGLSYSTAKNAYDKMRKLGQHNRANNLEQTYNDVNADNNAYYNFYNDELCVGDDKNYGRLKRGNDESGFDKSTISVFDETGDSPIDYKIKDSQFLRSSDKKQAKNMANNFNNYLGKKMYDKNRFIK